jgi:hypothetical protein
MYKNKMFKQEFSIFEASALLTGILPEMKMFVASSATRLAM